VTAIATGEAAALPPGAVRPVNPADYRPAFLNVGVIVWLASELMFFSGLFAAFYTLRASSYYWPTRGDHIDALTVGMATIILVASSFTMQMGVHRTTKGDKAGFLGWLALTFALGCLFDGMQVSDYAGRNFPIWQDAWTSCFYVLTGIHAIHVAGGLLGMVFMGTRAKFSKKFGHHTLPAVEFLSYYWHFVDVVWIALYASIFLLRGH
jgi:cytochrome c oxidase subunit 3